MDSQNKPVLLAVSEENTFFKFMHPKDYSERMFLPPKFARTVKDLVGKKVRLKNIKGQKWDVKVSVVDGYLAFKKGWPFFFQGNGIGKDDLLIFYYVSERHFTVDIFKRSTVCQKQVFTKRRTKRNKMIKIKKEEKSQE